VSLGERVHDKCPFKTGDEVVVLEHHWNNGVVDDIPPGTRGVISDMNRVGLKDAVLIVWDDGRRDNRSNYALWPYGGIVLASEFDAPAKEELEEAIESIRSTILKESSQ